MSALAIVLHAFTALVELFRRYRAETVTRIETLADENEWLRVVLRCGGSTQDSGEFIRMW